MEPEEELLQKAQFFSVHIGSLALIKPFLERMGVGKIIDSLCPSNPQKLLTHAQVIEVMVCNRLLSPHPLYRVEDWAKIAGIKYVYNIDPELLNDDRLADTLDAIHPFLPQLKSEIALYVAKEFNISLSCIHWDLTSFHFEGDYENQQEGYIQLVYSRSNRLKQPVKKEAKVGLDIANDGKGPVPVYFETLSGNSSEMKVTLRNMENLKKHLKVDKLLRINDRGCFSKEILARTKKEGFDLISSITFNEEYERLYLEGVNNGKEFEKLSYLSITQEKKKEEERDYYYGFEVLHHVEYEKKVYPLRVIFIRSDGKIRRDRKAREKRINKIISFLEQVRIKVDRKRPHYGNKEVIEKRIEKKLEKYPKEREYFKVEVSENSKGIKVKYWLDEEKKKEAESWDGIYVIGTTLPKEEFGIDRVFSLFKQQYHCESANRTLKNTLRLRPIFLHKQRRIESLIFILFLALMVYYLIERIYRNNVMNQKKKRRTTRELIWKFQGYGLVRIILNEKEFVRGPPPNLEQREILDTIGLELPWR